MIWHTPSTCVSVGLLLSGNTYIGSRCCGAPKKNGVDIDGFFFRYKRVMVFVVVFLIGCGIFTVGITKGDWVKESSKHYDLSVDAGEYELIEFWEGPNNKFQIEFRVTYGDDIDFFIFEENDRLKWEADGVGWMFDIRPSSVYEYREHTREGVVEFTINETRADIHWCAIFSNVYSVIMFKLISVDTTWFNWKDNPPDDNDNGLPIPGFDFIIVVLALPILTGWWHRQKAE